MVSRIALTEYLNQYLSCANFNDYAPNGLQIEGRSDIKMICSAVTASLDIIEHAIALQADALLVHHGYFWRGEEAPILGMKHKRIAKILHHDLNLLAYHLPLDCHVELGNNACLGRLFEFQHIQAHPIGNTVNLLWSGVLSKLQSCTELSDWLEQKLQRKPLCIAASEKPIHRIAWCSGGAQDYIVDAYHLGVDAYISGEVSERTYYQAKELGIHYFACGHHATERYGIQALGEHLTQQFKVSHQFIDNDNPV